MPNFKPLWGNEADLPKLRIPGTLYATLYGPIYETNRHGTSPDGVYIDRASRKISYVRGPNSTSSSTYSINQYLFSDVPLTDITGGYIEVAVKSDLLRGYDCTIQLMNKELVVVPY